MIYKTPVCNDDCLQPVVQLVGPVHHLTRQHSQNICVHCAVCIHLQYVRYLSTTENPQNARIWSTILPYSTKMKVNTLNVLMWARENIYNTKKYILCQFKANKYLDTSIFLSELQIRICLMIHSNTSQGENNYIRLQFDEDEVILQHGERKNSRTYIVTQNMLLTHEGK